MTAGPGEAGILVDRETTPLAGPIQVQERMAPVLMPVALQRLICP